VTGVTVSVTGVTAWSGGRRDTGEKPVRAVLIAVRRHVGVHDARQRTLGGGQRPLSYNAPSTPSAPYQGRYKAIYTPNIAKNWT